MKVCSISLNKSHQNHLKMFFAWTERTSIHLYSSGLYTTTDSGYTNYLAEVKKYIDDMFVEYDILLEFPFSFLYEYIYNKYPDTKFIYVNVDKEFWIGQMLTLKEIFSHENSPYLFEEFFCNYYVQTNKTKIQDLTSDELGQIYDIHVSGVNTFFEGKTNILMVDYNDEMFLEKIDKFVY